MFEFSTSHNLNLQVIQESMFNNLLLLLQAHWSFTKSSAEVVEEASISNTQYESERWSLWKSAAFPGAVDAKVMAWPEWAEAEEGVSNKEEVDG